eukprot:m.204743 g.204743  ORF g.204743 m.204743 type:complete len:821 (+) comp18474_c0_seq1:264-2726(+)
MARVGEVADADGATGRPRAASSPSLTGSISGRTASSLSYYSPASPRTLRDVTPSPSTTNTAALCTAADRSTQMSKRSSSLRNVTSIGSAATAPGVPSTPTAATDDTATQHVSPAAARRRSRLRRSISDVGLGNVLLRSPSLALALTEASEDASSASPNGRQPQRQQQQHSPATPAGDAATKREGGRGSAGSTPVSTPLPRGSSAFLHPPEHLTPAQKHEVLQLYASPVTLGSPRRRSRAAVSSHHYASRELADAYRQLELKQNDLERAARIGQSLLAENQQLTSRIAVLEQEQQVQQVHRSVVAQLEHDLAQAQEFLHSYEVEVRDLTSRLVAAEGSGVAGRLNGNGAASGSDLGRHGGGGTAGNAVGAGFGGMGRSGGGTGRSVSGAAVAASDMAALQDQLEQLMAENEAMSRELQMARAKYETKLEAEAEVEAAYVMATQRASVAEADLADTRRALSEAGDMHDQLVEANTALRRRLAATTADLQATRAHADALASAKQHTTDRLVEARQALAHFEREDAQLLRQPSISPAPSLQDELMAFDAANVSGSARRARRSTTASAAASPLHTGITASSSAVASPASGAGSGSGAAAGSEALLSPCQVCESRSRGAAGDWPACQSQPSCQELGIVGSDHRDGRGHTDNGDGDGGHGHHENSDGDDDGDGDGGGDGDHDDSAVGGDLVRLSQGWDGKPEACDSGFVGGSDFPPQCHNAAAPTDTEDQINLFGSGLGLGQVGSWNLRSLFPQGLGLGNYRHDAEAVAARLRASVDLPSPLHVAQTLQRVVCQPTIYMPAPVVGALFVAACTASPVITAKRILFLP